MFRASDWAFILISRQGAPWSQSSISDNGTSVRSIETDFSSLSDTEPYRDFSILTDAPTERRMTNISIRYVYLIYLGSKYFGMLKSAHIGASRNKCEQKQSETRTQAAAFPVHLCVYV